MTSLHWQRSCYKNRVKVILTPSPPVMGHRLFTVYVIFHEHNVTTCRIFFHIKVTLSLNNSSFQCYFIEYFSKSSTLIFLKAQGKFPFRSVQLLLKPLSITSQVSYLVFADYTCTFTGDNWTVFVNFAHSLVTHVPGQCLWTLHCWYRDSFSWIFSGDNWTVFVESLLVTLVDSFLPNIHL